MDGRARETHRSRSCPDRLRGRRSESEPLPSRPEPAAGPAPWSGRTSSSLIRPAPGRKAVRSRSGRTGPPPQPRWTRPARRPGPRAGSRPARQRSTSPRPRFVRRAESRPIRLSWTSPPWRFLRRAGSHPIRPPWTSPRQRSVRAASRPIRFPWTRPLLRVVPRAESAGTRWRPTTPATRPGPPGREGTSRATGRQASMCSSPDRRSTRLRGRPRRPSPASTPRPAGASPQHRTRNPPLPRLTMARRGPGPCARPAAPHRAGGSRACPRRSRPPAPVPRAGASTGWRPGRP
jgi:hypothetical protein